MKPTRYVGLTGEYIHQTDDAVKVKVDGVEGWLPKAAVRLKGNADYATMDEGDEFDFSCPDTLADEKGFS